MTRLSNIFCRLDAISMTVVFAGDRQFGANAAFLPRHDKKNGQIMKKYFDRGRKLYQIAWQPSEGGVGLAMQR